MLQVVHVFKCIPDLQPVCSASLKITSHVARQITLSLTVLQKHCFYWVNEESHYNFLFKI